MSTDRLAVGASLSKDGGDVQAAPLPELPRAINARMACEDCGGCGKTGEEMPQGEFQPPEYEDCSSCNGSGVWEIEAFSASQLRAYGDARALAALSQGWVSVNERLPEQEVAVLAVSPGGGLGVYSRVDDGEGWLWYRQTWCWNLADASGFECDDDYQITHWMNLPAAPKAADGSGGEAA